MSGHRDPTNHMGRGASGPEPQSGWVRDVVRLRVSVYVTARVTGTLKQPSSPQLSDSKDAFKKTWNSKFTLRSHYDGIRSLAFHHSQSALLTASEDGTLKLWNLQKAVTAKK